MRTTKSVYRKHLVLSLLLGCAQEEEPHLVSVSALGQASVPRPAEDHPRSVALEIPTFAGYYCEDGDLHVGVAAAATASEISKLVNRLTEDGIAFYCRNRFGPDHESDIKVVRKNYTFNQLSEWRDALLHDLASSDSWRGIGINYKRNVIRVGVTNGAAPAVSARAQAYVAASAIEIYEGERSRPFACNPAPYSGATLDFACFRPVPGGVELNSTAPSGPPGNGECTMTVGGTRLSNSQLGWVTASHCLNDSLVGQNASQKVYQINVTDPADFIGTELIDPPTFNCFNFFNCRLSDSTWIRDDSALVQHGQIVQTQSWSSPPHNDDPLQTCCHINCAACSSSTLTPRFHIYGSAPLVEGMVVEKVGRTTGWSSGVVEETCHDETDGLGHLYLCQGVTNFVSYKGDSGAPVFFWWASYGVNTAQLVGLLWGGDSDGRYFSPWANVENELGSMSVRYTPTWQSLAQASNDVGVSGDGFAWITTKTSTYGGYTIRRWTGSGWSTVGGGAVRIAVAPGGNAWVINSFGNIFRWTGSTWQQMPGAASDIGIGANGSVWIVGTTGAPGGNTVSYWSGANWILVPGGATRIAVDPSGIPWIRAADYTIWKRVSGNWQQVSGLAVDLGVGGDGMVWVLGTSANSSGNEIFWWSGINWVLAPGRATAIGVARGGKPWVANNLNQTYRAL